MFNQKSTIALSVMCALAISQSSFAGRVDVVNENKKALVIKIQADGNSLDESLATYVKKIPAQHYYTFNVDPSDLKSKTYYSIKGDTNKFTIGGKCDRLSVTKNYTVTFLNDATGTTCMAEEVK